MAIEKLFRVVTDFQFEIASAVANASTLQNSLQSVTSAADALQNQLMAVPKMLLASFAGYFTIGGIFNAAVGSQQKLQKASLALSNVISANMDKMSGDVGSFNERMMASRQIIESVARTANKFNLDESAMVTTFESMAAMLAPKGLAGTNFNVALELSRGLLKSAPLLGVDPFLVQNQLREIIEGRAGMQNTLFARLSAETTAFQGVGKKGTDSVAKQFNTLSVTERLDRLRKGLLTFANDMDVVHGSAMLLSSLMTRIRNQIFGLNSVFRPLGEVLVPRLEMGLMMVSDAIENYARPFLERFAGLVEKIFQDPARAWATLQQIRGLQKDLATTGGLFQRIAMVELVTMASAFLLNSKRIQNLISSAGLPGLAKAIAALGIVSEVTHKRISAVTGTDAIASAFVGIRTASGAFGKVAATVATGIQILRFALVRIAAPIVVVTTAFSIFTRAAAYAAVDLKLKWAALAKEFVQGSGARILSASWDIIRIFDNLMDRMARSVAFLASDLVENIKIFLASTAGMEVMSALAASLEFLRDSIVGTLSALAWGGRFLLSFQDNLLMNLAAIAWETDKALANIGLLFDAFFLDLVEAIKGPLTGLMSVIDYAMRGHFVMARGALDNLFSSDAVFGRNLRATSEQIGLTTANFKNPFEEANRDFMEVWNELRGGFGKGALDEKTVVNRNINQNVNINQSFREQQEPDRIARSLVNTLKELADNPRQSRGPRASMSAPFLQSAGL